MQEWYESVCILFLAAVAWYNTCSGKKIMSTETTQLIEKLEEKVFAKRPILRDILKENGDKTLRAYAKTYYRAPSYPIDPTRKNEFLAGFKQEVASIFGEEIAESAAKQMDKSYHVANTEHHGAIGTDRQLNNSLITSLPFLQTPDPDFPNNIIIACSNISFNNWTFPRGFMFHTYSNKGLSDGHLSFFGHTVDAYPVINYKGYNADSLKNMRKLLYTMWNERFIWKREYKKLVTLIDEVFADKSVLAQTTYTNQAAKFNYLLWERIGKVLNKPLQRLLFVEQEQLANRLLLNYHLEQDTTIHKILFDPAYLDLITKYFDGILCGFSESKQYGTFHFWALPPGKKYRTQLWRKGNKLVSPDGSYEVALTPTAIRSAIEKNELIPSTLLCFILFCFYYGVRQIGGPNQTTYLTQMKQAYISFLEELGDVESVALCKDIPTTDIVPGNPAVLAFLKGHQGELIPATPLDLYLYGTPETIATITSVSNTITLGESVKRTLPVWYKRCYTEEEREKELSEIKAPAIDNAIGLATKLTPFTSIGDKVIL